MTYRDFLRAWADLGLTRNGSNVSDRTSKVPTKLARPVGTKDGAGRQA